ncbi:chromosome segregation protein SMC [Vibrio parahaemolyticus]|uniref:AAA family ATPase n=1 Tax=Vibrio harveyi group TaxID=717610 RepID=UPI0003FB7035|nr:AAA family ATPase [Vibrio parahaemolyticus]ELB1649980.1 AAA family ATPase [Vibrio parahaemolyticus]OQJ92875.1 chromosome segregation protein SMC [Vibrio parahaemolyticus]OQS78403.1 chromosome segregation protein SMC [Vibrio parahaemolyticus]OQS97614.1 chromosome segregation protein SMC [Vibrio parahaemolyticus O4:K12 str. K1203]PNO26433.1 chromosome segregation protein SMC [Vibrio parahaemolyticus]
MKIDYLHIRSGFKNVEDLEIDFDNKQLLTVLIGRNGSGKSNVIEALVRIFRALDFGDEPAPFSYKLRYSLGSSSDRLIEVEASPEYGSTPIQQHKIQVSILDESGQYSLPESISLSKVTRDKEGNSDYLPKHLFAYYSGPSDRLEDLFKPHRTKFYNQLLKNQVKIEDEVRPLFYAKPFHSQFVLLAFFLNQQKGVGREFLQDQLGIESFHSAHFVFRRPEWGKNNKKDLFWGARGVVRDFLERILPHSLGAIKTVREEETTLTGKGVNNEFAHLFLPDLYSLKKVAQGLGAKNFFKMLESTLLSDLLSSVHIKVRLKNGEIVSFSELSEGEQQLLTVLGLLEFTMEEDSLFLLDEPDTHLNPAWAAKYHSFLKRFIPDKRFCHILMVTHHPLAIAELKKEQIQVLRKDVEGQSLAEIPSESPIGMGVNGILTSDMFDMATTLDQHTSKVIEDRRELLEKDSLTEAESRKLSELNNSLDRLGYSYTHPDEDYRQFLIARKKAMQQMDYKDEDSIELRLKLINAILKDQGLIE